jgi:hypothetical protein
MMNWRVYGKTGSGIIRYVVHTLAWRDWQRPQNTLVKIIGVSAEIRTGHLPIETRTVARSPTSIPVYLSLIIQWCILYPTGSIVK